MNTASAQWAAVTASVRGAAHERTGLPNQDAVTYADVEGSTSGLVAAVADGHGGSRYVRSNLGAGLAVKLGCEVAARAVLKLGPCPNEPSIHSELERPLIDEVIGRWRAQVSTHLSEHPFSSEERGRAGTALDADPHLAYGCTLILGLFGPNWVGLLQIGDGDVSVVRGGVVSCPIPGDPRLVGGETTSLCLPTAASDARVAALTGVLPELVFLSTDGYGNSFASPSWQQDVGRDLSEYEHRNGLEALAAELPGWLAESGAASGDDVSMALVQRARAAGRSAPSHRP